MQEKTDTPYPEDGRSNSSISWYPIFQTTRHYILTKALIGILKSCEKLKFHINIKSSLRLITGYAIGGSRVYSSTHS
jgi:hypothetical protein